MFVLTLASSPDGALVLAAGRGMEWTERMVLREKFFCRDVVAASIRLGALATARVWENEAVVLQRASALRPEGTILEAIVS